MTIKKMKYILGINLHVHDTAFYLLDDKGNLVFGVEEEKVIKTRYHMTSSYYALDYMLKRTGVDKKDIIGVGLTSSLKEYEKLFERHKTIYGEEMAVRHEKAIRRLFEYRHNLINSMSLPNAEVMEVPHHLAHALSAFSTSPFYSAGIVAIDGNGENETTVIFHATDKSIIKKAAVLRPNSVGWIWEAITKWLRLGVQGNEGKTMGLAAYGRPVYKDQFYNGFEAKIGAMPFFKVDWSTGLFESPVMKELYGWTLELDDILGESPSYDKIPNQYQRDIAATLQEVTNEILIALTRYAKEVTGEENLVLCGGVAMNSVSNGIVERSGIFNNVYVPCNASDNGTALGSALYVYNRLIKENCYKVKCKLPYTSCNYSENEITETLKKFSLPVNRSDDIVRDTAAELEKGAVVGWFQEKLELGARALGNRSILALPYPQEVKDKVNMKVKFRESWRPFAPLIKEEAFKEWFDSNVKRVPYMTSTQPFKKGVIKKVVAVVHEDGTGRVQTCSKDDNLKLYSLLSEIEQNTSIPILLNTSFNIKGMPIVCSPDDAVLCYLCTDIDVLVVGDYIVRKSELKHDRASLVRVSHAGRFIEMTIEEGTGEPVFIIGDSGNENELLHELLKDTLDKKNITYKVLYENDMIGKANNVYIVNTYKNPYSEFNGGLKKKITMAYKVVRDYNATCYLLNLTGASFVFNQLFNERQWQEVVSS